MTIGGVQLGFAGAWLIAVVLLVVLNDHKPEIAFWLAASLLVTALIIAYGQQGA